MKSKKIKKIVKQTIEEMHGRDRPMKSVMYTGDWGKYDSEVSDKVKTMVLNLVNYRNNINISINSDSLSIGTENLSGVKKSYNNSPVLKSNDDDYLSIEIIKNAGFTINKGYRTRSNYLDPKIFDELLPLLTEKLAQINSDNFKEIWTDIMKESGLIRDNNIDELLKQINE
jgi:hypothetical protein